MDYTLNPHLFIPDTFNATLLTKKTVRALTLMRERGELKEAVSPKGALDPGTMLWARGGRDGPREDTMDPGRTLSRVPCPTRGPEPSQRPWMKGAPGNMRENPVSCPSASELGTSC